MISSGSSSYAIMPMYSARSVNPTNTSVRWLAGCPGDRLDLPETIDRTRAFPSGVASHVAIDGRRDRESRGLPDRALDRGRRDLSERRMDDDSEGYEQ